MKCLGLLLAVLSVCAITVSAIPARHGGRGHLVHFARLPFRHRSAKLISEEPLAAISPDAEVLDNESSFGAFDGADDTFAIGQDDAFIPQSDQADFPVEFDEPKEVETLEPAPEVPVNNKPKALLEKEAGQRNPPGSTFFPVNFGRTQGGAIAVANSFSTGKGGSATSHATAYGAKA